EAAAIWRKMHGDTASQNLLQNAGFATKPADKGFDWRLPGLRDVAQTIGPPGTLRLRFDGKQAMDIVPVSQLAVLSEGAYTLSWNSSSDTFRPAEGLRFLVRDFDSGQVIVEGNDLKSGDWTRDALTFRIAREVRAVWVELRCTRRPGALRVEGEVCLRELGLRRTS
ncbi:MAG TPA: hypothetical protein VE621_17935, partial [Bryobacteraceae bacterium]|nr:hypothetical protein [Bryobacteraceae bacterium]